MEQMPRSGNQDSGPLSWVGVKGMWWKRGTREASGFWENILSQMLFYARYYFFPKKMNIL